MTPKLTLLTFALAALSACDGPAQRGNYGKISVNEQLPDTFSFTKRWDYAWDILRDDSTGEFSRADDQPLTPADTAHLFYTADCHTSVQGGYPIRYCFAERQRDTITLTFADGLPAYASRFLIYLTDGRFHFRPEVIYPGFIPGQKISYRTVKSQLIVNKNRYEISDKIRGYVAVEFEETVLIPRQPPQKHIYNLVGHFSTPLHQSPPPGVVEQAQ